MSLIFIAMPTKGSVISDQIRSNVLQDIALLHVAYPQHTFIAPMIQDYQLLPYLPSISATWEDWGKHCRCLIEKSDEVWVMMLEGWKESTGVTAEVEYATSLGIDVKYLLDGQLFAKVRSA